MAESKTNVVYVLTYSSYSDNVLYSETIGVYTDWDEAYKDMTQDFQTVRTEDFEGYTDGELFIEQKTHAEHGEASWRISGRYDDRIITENLISKKIFGGVK